MLYSLLLVAARRTVCCLLLHAVQFAICGCSIQLLFVAPHRTVVFGCRMTHSLLFVVARCRVAFVAVCRTVCYLLPHAVQLLFLPHAVYFAICCSAPYSCYLLLYTVFVAACHTVAIYCRMLYSLLFVATSRKICYLLPHAVQLATATAYYRVCYSLHHTMHAVPYLLLHVLQFAIGCCIPV